MSQAALDSLPAMTPSRLRRTLAALTAFVALAGCATERDRARPADGDGGDTMLANTRTHMQSGWLLAAAVDALSNGTVVVDGDGDTLAESNIDIAPNDRKLS